jgi:hypothetical protein
LGIDDRQPVQQSGGELAVDAVGLVGELAPPSLTLDVLDRVRGLAAAARS